MNIRLVALTGLIVIISVGCEKSQLYSESLTIGDGSQKQLLLTELDKENINYKMDGDNVIWFSQLNKQKVYASLNAIITAQPKEVISTSCEFDETLTKK